MSFYVRAEGIILKYLYFLNEKNVLKDYKIERAHARDIYMAEFKKTYNITRFSFSTMYRLMLDFGLIHYQSKGTEFICFRQDMFNYSIRYFTKSDLKAKVNEINVKPITNENIRVKHECPICIESFLNSDLLAQHERSEAHLQMKDWTKKNNATSTPEIVIEIVDGHGGTPETVVIRQKIRQTIVLSISNQSSHDYIIRDMTGKTSPYVTIHKLDPCYLLKVNSKETISLIAMFPENIFWSYRLAFYIQNATTKTHSLIVKELTFQVHSELVDDLHPTEPFHREPQQNIRNGEAEIVPGVHPPLPPSKFNYKTKFGQHPLPHYMVVLSDNKFTQFPNMNATEKTMLSHIKKEFAYYTKVSSTLDSKNYYNMNKIRLHMEEYQMKIDIRNYDKVDQVLKDVKSFPKNCLELSVPGLAEQRPSILRGDSVFIQENPESKIKYEGIVHKVNESSVILGLSHRFIETVHIKNKKYAVSFTFNRIPLRAEHQANELAKKHDVIPLFCPVKITANPLTVNKLIWYNNGIGKNEKQQQAIWHIISETSRPYPYLIFGPPGTGKTITVVEAILQIRKLKPETKILVSAPTNSAADEIAKRLIGFSKAVNMFRYVAPSYPYDAIDINVKPYSNCRDGFYYPDMNEILNYSVVITTLITAFRLVNGGTPPKHFSYVFIDESGQATETETLIPIVGILTNEQNKGLINGQVVLVGDPQQLGPVIHSSKAKDYGFGISMLERLMTHCASYKRNENSGSYDNNVLTKLINSYRSHHAILNLPNKLFYHGELLPPPKDHLLPNVAIGWSQLPNKDFPVVFHSIMGKDEREANSPSYFNLQEVDIVVQYLEKLIGNRMSGMKIEESHIGVITPYRKQVYKLKKACSKKKWDKLKIGSVEQFQGQERLIIILSTVRSDIKFAVEDIKFHLGFLQNKKRFNVAITRAKALLIVIGNPNLLQHDIYWKSFIEYCKDNGSFVGTPFELHSETVNLAALAAVALPQANGVLNEDIKEENTNFSRGNI